MTPHADDGRAPRRVPPGSARAVRLAVVDDYEIVRAGVSAMLEPYAGRVRVVELTTSEPDQEDVDVVLYDTDTQTSGTRVSLEVLLGRRSVGAGRAPGQRPPRVVVFSWNVEAARVDTALRRGAAGYLSKGLTAVDLVTAVEQVHAGERVRPEAEGDDDEPAGGWRGQGEGLSVREAATIALITQGLSNQEIADRSFLSINSVKTYIRSAYRKIGVSRRSQAVLWGLQHGFDAPDRAVPGAGQAGQAGADLTRRPPASRSASRPPSRSAPPAAEA
ncbi:response regulator transcription factor [Nocardioides sp. AX2bis]|uniref:response regulator transcription factor n=1 Tax=Nocardioides sp. AX2bis TaxID=2653157 RepID=UPI0012F055F3|nr:response regulator transcription factor [Nocardioides sp. AX2bis]VXC58108.1 hypothetical protein NOCARDAX2BIS_90094 [Nocardioides sp. AX2bis]